MLLASSYSSSAAALVFLCQTIALVVCPLLMHLLLVTKMLMHYAVSNSSYCLMISSLAANLNCRMSSSSCSMSFIAGGFNLLIGISY